MNALTKELNRQCESVSFHTGWFLKSIDTGLVSTRLGDIIVPSASVRKIAILMTALRSVSRGELSLEQRLEIEERYQNNDSGCFQHLKPDFSISLRDGLIMMIIVSDNTCTGPIADMLGLNNINEFSQSVGMIGTAHRHSFPPLPLAKDHRVDYTNATTPSDVGFLLSGILEGAYDEKAAMAMGCTSNLCRFALDILSWQKLKTRLPALLPLGTKVAHKTGTGARNYNDAGIIYRNDRPSFILSVFTENVPDVMDDGSPGFASASHLIARLAQTCYHGL